MLTKKLNDEQGNDSENKQQKQQRKCSNSDCLVIRDPSAPSWTIRDFDIGMKLGEGQFGCVYLARERRSNYLIALKVITKAQLLSTNNEHLLRREIEIHSHLLHPHILQFYGWFTTQKRILLILELAPNGELMDKLNYGGLPEPQVSRYMFQIIAAIRCCHRLNVMHRDLKPENILVDRKDNLKLADFGWAAHVPAERPGDVSPSSNNQAAKQNSKFKYLRSRRKTYCGTLDYLPPEICKHEWYGKEVDVWCLGVLCFELATGGPPFSHEMYVEKGAAEHDARKMQQKDIQHADIRTRFKGDLLSRDLQDFLTRSLAKDPTDRMTTRAMLNHPFIKRHNEVAEELSLRDSFEIRSSSFLSENQAMSRLLSTPNTAAGIQGPAAGMSQNDNNCWAVSRTFSSAAMSPGSGLLLETRKPPTPTMETIYEHLNEK